MKGGQLADSQCKFKLAVWQEGLISDMILAFEGAKVCVVILYNEKALLQEANHEK